MKAKNRKKKQKKSSLPKLLLLILLTLLLAVEVMWLLNRQGHMEEENAVKPTEAAAPAATEMPATVPSAESAEPEMPTEAEATETQTQNLEMKPINLGFGLVLEQVTDYTGAYMEDGSDEIVSGVMMALISNTGEKDLQYAKIEVAFDSGSYLFEITDLPAGADVVALEKNRAQLPSGSPVSAVLANSAFFPESTSTYPEIFEISGANGMLNIKNISENEVFDDIYIHYKNKIGDTYYGGIAYRVKVEGGLKAGEIRQVMTGHYNPDNCIIVAIELIPTGNG